VRSVNLHFFAMLNLSFGLANYRDPGGAVCQVAAKDCKKL